jgi:hypothetical protein
MSTTDPNSQLPFLGGWTNATEWLPSPEMNSLNYSVAGWICYILELIDNCAQFISRVQLRAVSFYPIVNDAHVAAELAHIITIGAALLDEVSLSFDRYYWRETPGQALDVAFITMFRGRWLTRFSSFFRMAMSFFSRIAIAWSGIIVDRNGRGIPMLNYSPSEVDAGGEVEYDRNRIIRQYRAVMQRIRLITMTSYRNRSLDPLYHAMRAPLPPDFDSSGRFGVSSRARFASKAPAKKVKFQWPSNIPKYDRNASEKKYLLHAQFMATHPKARAVRDAAEAKMIHREWRPGGVMNRQANQR